MTVVLSPKMVKDDCDLALASNRNRSLFCCNELEEFVEIPDARFYWVEASDKQWKDGSGARVEVCIDGVFPEYQMGKFYGDFHDEDVIIKALKKLGVKADGKHKTIYFRLLYQE